jgi:hypothetical protein
MKVESSYFSSLPLMVTAFLLLFVFSCKRKLPDKNVFIETAGVFSIGCNAEIEVFIDKNSLLNIKHTRTSGNESYFIDGIIDSKAAWFIYVENCKKFYLYRDGRLDVFYETSTESGNKLVAVLTDGNINGVESSRMKEIPQPVRERVVKELGLAGGVKSKG